MSKFKLTCTNEQFNNLQGAVQSVRSDSAEVKVNKAALEALLNDHSNLLTIHERKIDAS